MTWNGTATKWFQFGVQLLVIAVAAVMAFGSLTGEVKRLDVCVKNIEKVNLRQYSEIRSELILLRSKVDKTHDEVIKLKTIIEFQNKGRVNVERVAAIKANSLPTEKTVWTDDSLYAQH